MDLQTAPIIVIAVACVLLAAVVVAVAIVLLVLRMEDARLARSGAAPDRGGGPLRGAGGAALAPPRGDAGWSSVDAHAYPLPHHAGLAGRQPTRASAVDRLLAPAESAWLAQVARSLRIEPDAQVRRQAAAEVVRRGGAGAAWVVLDAVRAGVLEPWVACEELAAGSFDVGVVAGAASVDHDPRVRAVASQLLDGVLATAPLPRFAPAALPAAQPAPAVPPYPPPTVHARPVAPESAQPDGTIVRPAPFSRFPLGPS